jgi:hypothetical protein
VNSTLTSKLKPLLPTLPGPGGIGLSEPHLDSAGQVGLDLGSGRVWRRFSKVILYIDLLATDWVLLI